MARVSAGSTRPWEIMERPMALEVLLLQQTYILPWNQFLYADGRDDEIRIAFATHDVLIKAPDSMPC